MKVAELMTSAVITASPDTAILDARQLMLKERIRHLLVTEAEQPRRYRHGPGHPAQSAIPGHEPLGVGDQPSAYQAHGGRGHDQDDDHDRAGLRGAGCGRPDVGSFDRRLARDRARPAGRHHHRDRHHARILVAGGRAGIVSPGPAPEALTGSLPREGPRRQQRQLVGQVQLFAVEPRRLP